MRHLQYRVIASCAALAVISFACGARAAEWKPERNVEIIVPTSPGGSNDKTGRLLQKLWQDQRVLEVSITVVNKPGGAGVPALNYLNQRAGDGHLMDIVSATLLTANITGQNPSFHRDVTPLALLCGEYYVLAVREDSPLRNGRDVVEGLKRDPGSLAIGIGSALGGQSHTSVMLALKAAGVNVKRVRTVVFNSSAQSIAAVMGGHVDLVPAPSSTVKGQLATGKVRAIVVSAPKRLAGGFAEVPTWKEQGIDAVVSNWRAAVGPKGMSAAAVAFWDAVFARTVKTPEWRQDLERNLWEDTYMASAATARFLEAEHQETKAILTELGLAR